MRILFRSILWYFLLSIFVFGIGGMIAYILVTDAVREETDYELLSRFLQTRKSLKLGADMEHLTNYNVRINTFDNITCAHRDSFFTDTIIYLRRTERLETFRKLVGFQTVEDKNYRIEVVDIIFEQEDIVKVVSQIILRLFLFMSFAVLMGSILISSRLMQPFRSILQSIQSFSLKSDAPFALQETNVYEFKKLNGFLSQMTSKARKDYQSLKEFTENASHELQTPIAIAKGKLELLQQQSNTDADQSQLIAAAQQSLTKLSKLGSALSLLTKIENHEFTSQERINFSDLVSRTSTLFQEIAAMQEVELRTEIEPDIQLRIDHTLADILVTNLLKNAIQHNIEGGWITITLDKWKLSVKNTGRPLKISADELFTRFKKSDQTKGTLGLGLAIVKKICQVNNMRVDYVNRDNVHEVNIVF